MGIQDSVLFDRSLLGDLLSTTNTTQTSTAAGIVTSTEQLVQAASNQPGFNFNNSPLGNSGSTKALTNSDRVGPQGLSHFAVGRVNNELGFGGLVLSASSESISVLIRALQESRRLDVLSRPQVRTLDNQPAFIQVGQRVPRIVATNITEGGLQTNAVELENVGLILGVTPRISPDGTVVMEIDAEKSSLGLEQEGIPITVSVDGSVIRSPRINTTTAQTTVSAASGETIIIGGLITKESQVINRRVPYLSEIPLLGNVFRYDSTINRRNELLIILTPHVIHGSGDSQQINQVEMSRMSWCEADLFELHGDLGLSATPEILHDQATEVIYPDVNPRGESTVAPLPEDFLTPEPTISSFETTHVKPVPSPTNFDDSQVRTASAEEPVSEESSWPFR
jgi:type II secretory pathway component GspD/PulD (secretin)